MDCENCEFRLGKNTILQITKLSFLSFGRNRNSQFRNNRNFRNPFYNSATVTSLERHKKIINYLVVSVSPIDVYIALLLSRVLLLPVVPREGFPVAFVFCEKSELDNRKLDSSRANGANPFDNVSIKSPVKLY